MSTPAHHASGQQSIPTPYEDLLREILDENRVAIAADAQRKDRTGTGTFGVFGRQMRFDLRGSFPLITTKRVHFKSVAVELLWFLRGSSNIRWLQERGVTIWDEWADENGDLGPVYGVQWRSWPTPDGGTIDQIAKVIESLKTNPSSRRHIVSAWNPAEVDEMALPPCHAMFQFYVHERPDGVKELSCQLYQRSADMFLGVPFNIASYALLTYLIAHEVNMEPGEFIWTGGDCHIYSNHLEQVKKQLGYGNDPEGNPYPPRAPYPYPKLVIKTKEPSIFDYEYEDFELVDYKHHPGISAPIAV